ncbi:unnamed protein product [Phytomonas sp. Hart1]|nr:unnamed protein product [Phytomonas sp. Hart1]|eukprot:CCW68425.1 unnamed protein product [Phytomonas sp. isolate Hart1]
MSRHSVADQSRSTETGEAEFLTNHTSIQPKGLFCSKQLPRGFTWRYLRYDAPDFLEFVPPYRQQGTFVTSRAIQLPWRQTT